MTDAVSPRQRWSQRQLAWRRFATTWRPGWMLLALLAGMAIGAIVGRATTPAHEPAAARDLEQHLVPLVIDADSIWSSGSDDRVAVAEALVALRNNNNPALVLQSYEQWLSSYDSILLRLAGIDLPTSARPVQRQFIVAVTMSRDAVEVLGHAARVTDPIARRDLTTEVGRLRQRSEQLTQAGRASITDLGGQRSDVAPLGSVTDFLEGRP
ncbi:MAG: hypothetical protein WD576_03890 [Nitriliruptoraceae bacterium]